MKDILSREDIVLVVNEFYRKALNDREIGHFFNKVVQLDLQKHIPVICDFWEMVIFGSGPYKSNPMEKHFALHEKSAIEPHHFRKWLELWEATIKSKFEGPRADEAINRAKTIAGVMQLKLDQLK